MIELNPTTIILGLSITIIVLLSLVIYLQSKKIKDLERPRYGFLGKPLSILIIVGVLSGSIGFALFVNTEDVGTDVISADRELSISISYLKEQTDVYVLKATPIIDGVSWDNDPSLNFDIFWTIKNEEGEVYELVETQVSQLEPSSITVQLDKGSNEITSKIVLKSRLVKQEITIDVE